MAALAEAFFREGCVVVSGVLTSAETAMLRAKTDEYAANPDTPKEHISYAGTTLVLRRCHEMDPVFEALTMSESYSENCGSRAGTGASVQRNECDSQRKGSGNFPVACG